MAGMRARRISQWRDQQTKAARERCTWMAEFAPIN